MIRKSGSYCLERVSAPSPKSLGFRRRSVGCFSRRERSAAIWIITVERATQKQPTGRGPEGCVENGSAASLFVSHVSIQICSFLPPRRRPILNPTKPKGFRRRCTSRGALPRDPASHVSTRFFASALRIRAATRFKRVRPVAEAIRDIRLAISPMV